MSSLESTAERELLDLTERRPTAFELELDDAPAPDAARRVPAASDTPASETPRVSARASQRRATVPPPIPERALARRATVPPPIPARALTRTPRASTAVPTTTPTEVPTASAAPVTRRAPTTALPPIPERALARRATVPPPIPERALSRSPRGTGVMPAAAAPPPPPDDRAASTPSSMRDDGSVDIDLTPTMPPPRLAAVLPVEPAALIDAPPTNDPPRDVATAQEQHDAFVDPWLAANRKPRSRLGRWLVAGIVVAGAVAAWFALRGGETTREAPAASADVTPAAPVVAPVTPPTPVVAPAPVAEPPQAVATNVEAAPVEAPPPAPEVPTTHQIQLTSKPAGATVTLVDNGEMKVVGETPLAVTIDRARSYEVVFTLTGYDTRIEQLAASADELEVALESPPPPKRRKRSRARTARAETGTATGKGGTGTLMISTKPPTEIVIDGVATVLTTPQRSLELTPGKHKITLFNLSQGIDQTIEVSIKSRKTTKLIRDFTRNRRSGSSR